MREKWKKPNRKENNNKKETQQKEYQSLEILKDLAKFQRRILFRNK